MTYSLNNIRGDDMNRKRLLLKAMLIGLPIVVCLLWITGAINLWFYGMGDIAKNVKDYYLELEPINGTYSVLIDLSDPENYKDGDSFGLYLIPHDTEVNVIISEDPIIEITLSNLIMHKWGRK